MFNNFCFTTVFLFLSCFVFGQVGKIAGKVTDKQNNEFVIGAAVIISGTSTGAATDLDGNYEINNVAVGTYKLQVRYLSYKMVEVADVKVVEGKTTTVNFSLEPNEDLKIDEVVVTTARITNTEQAVVLEVKNAQQVVSGASKEQILKSQDNTAAQVIQRIPGVTVVDNRFVMIRGLSERYNSVMINNVVAPSTEVDKRTFSFDLISSGALDRMLIYKSGSADLPGDFAGGVIKLYTVEDVAKPYTNIKFGYGHRAGTSFRPYFQSQGSSTDMLGFDRSFRALPGNFPTTDQLGRMSPVSQERMDAGHTLPNNFLPTQRMALPDFSVGLDMGRVIKLKKGKQLTTINNLNYSVSHQYYEREFSRYFEWVDQTKPIDRRFAFIDDTYQQDVKINVLSNWVLRINDRNKIKFKNLFNQIGENETVIRNGEDFIQRPNDDLRNYLLGYRSRSIYTGQLEGNHIVKDNRVLNWVIGGSFLKESEPDLRRFRTFRPRSSSQEAGYQMQLPPSSNLFETGRYFGDLKEFSINNGVEYIMKLDDKKDGKKINFGYYTDYRYRSFDSRYFSYLYPGFNDPTEGERLRRLPLDEIFSTENVRTRDGFILEEGTRPIDAYTASNFLNAAYGNFIIPIKRFKVTGGVRLEYNIQTMTSRSDFEIIEVNNPIFSPLPFVNINYEISPKSIVRVGYSRTINRPEFRELAPFLFYDYKYEAGRVGNPDLKTATINNFDVRYEFYPRSGETFSIGAFYKHFTNPIENRTIVTTEQPTFSYINADRAINYGLELEFRKSLKGVTRSRIVDNFSMNINASYIISEVDLGVTAVAQERVRPLQGQSPYIFNAAVSYNEPKRNMDITVAYNIIGNRIFSVGDVLFPTIYELSRHSLDLTFNKKIGERINLKVGIQDILNYPFRFFEDSDRNEKINDKDNPIVVFRRGSLFSVAFSYNLNKSN